MELVDELVELMAYCCPERKEKEATEAGKPIPVNVYHRQWAGCHRNISRSTRGGTG